MQDIQEKLRRKRQEPSFCLKIKADMACQSFQERNLWMRPSNKVWFEMLNSVILNETEGEITPLDTTMYQAATTRSVNGQEHVWVSKANYAYARDGFLTKKTWNCKGEHLHCKGKILAWFH